jgi:YegS/Rv2252/BmrU family lipid kinase
VRVAVVLNPIAGVRNSLDRTRRRGERAADLLASAGVEPEILITEQAGHARELAQRAVARGARLVVAWGGDGTVNEVASALAFGPVPLGVIPAGSGNGLARLFNLPANPAAAIGRLLAGRDHLIDLGELNGRLFVNVAGMGFDAHVAARFASLHRSRRGFMRYAGIVFHELRTYRGVGYQISCNGQAQAEHHAFLISFANGRQWGNGAVIAPDAAIDDGLLDAVVVSTRTRGAVLRALPRLFAGTIDRASGVEIRRIVRARVVSDQPLACHVDGEAIQCGHEVEVRVHPGALKIRI